MKRRLFLGLSGLFALPQAATSAVANTRRKNVLVLGGTRYLGPVITEELLRRGHSVTLFNRGITNPDLFPEVPRIVGDRETEDGSGLHELEQNQQQWDWVVDTWRGSSRAVEDTAKILGARTKQYQYVSTVSVYDKWDRVGITEDEPLNPLPGESEPILSENRYAIRKTFAEQILRRLLPNKSVMFRSHGLRGLPTSAPKHEPYWQVKISRGKNLVAPSDAEYYQVTDMVSLAQFMVHAGEQQLKGAYNVAYPPMKFKDFILDIVATLKSNVTLHWLPQDFLLCNEAKLIRTEPAGRYRFDVSKALNHGLKNRSTSAMLADQLKGYNERNPEDDFEFGKPETATISTERETDIIELWSRETSD